MGAIERWGGGAVETLAGGLLLVIVLITLAEVAIRYVVGGGRARFSSRDVICVVNFARITISASQMRGMKLRQKRWRVLCLNSRLWAVTILTLSLPAT